ncbi:MAG TPA: hypothetical protein VKY31_05575 [Terriglobia bacterium]|jgi:hypothetical protein|nr:hypothetical protein [Terriglobia bacterium]
MSQLQLLYGQVLANVIALTILFLCWKYRTAGRLSLVLLFVWAGLYNLWAAFAVPEQYLVYAKLASATWYQKFILGFFAEHTTAVVACIALGQLAVAVLMSMRDTAVYLGLSGAIISLVALAPLGSGSAFPSTLIAAFGAILLLQFEYHTTLQGELRNALTHHVAH